VIAVVYVIIYISFGMFVFRPLAGEAFQEYYADLQMPGWILPFQMVRAMIWTALVTASNPNDVRATGGKLVLE